LRAELRLRRELRLRSKLLLRSLRLRLLLQEARSPGPDSRPPGCQEVLQLLHLLLRGELRMRFGLRAELRMRRPELWLQLSTDEGMHGRGEYAWIAPLQDELTTTRLPPLPRSAAVLH
jgi:hypothetical protein